MTDPDSVDGLLESWQRTRPDLDVSPLGVVLRIGRIRALMEQRMEQVMARHGLTLGDFSALAAIARLEGADGVSQARMMEELGLTSGTVSVRVDRLVAAGHARRATDPRDRRGSLVSLTPAGREAFEAAAPDHLTNEHRMLEGLSTAERAQLEALLRTLLAGLERDPSS